MTDNDFSTQDLTIPRMSSYLELSGWQRVHDNESWRVFHGRKSASGKRFEIALPKDVIEEDYRLHVHHAIKILSSLQRKTWESAAYDILYHDRDLLRTRIIENAANASLPYDLASSYVRYMKKLIQYSASSERNARAHFKQPLSTGSKMLKHFRFGQTFKGSFGLQIVSSVGEEKHYVNKRKQHSLPGEEFRILPMERRVLERIARGLKATLKSRKQQDAEPLKQEFGGGFNSRMCEAIRDMIKISSEPFELSIIWSKTLSPSKDVGDIGTVRIGHEHIVYLDSAVKHLTYVPVNEATIKGRVIALSSSGNPQSKAVEERSIILDSNVEQKRSRKVRMNLTMNDYKKAHTAHMNWDTVSVTGLLQMKGSLWHMSDPRDFQILT